MPYIDQITEIAPKVQPISSNISNMYKTMNKNMNITWLRFSMDLFRVFDIHVLQRSNAVQSYTPEQIGRALNQYRYRVQSYTPVQIDRALNSAGTVQS